MKGCCSVPVALFLALVLLPALVSSFSRLTDHGSSGHHHSTRACKGVETMVKSETYYVTTKQWKPDTLQVAVGSGLPDCSHACGACRPCRLAMVSFICATIQEAETCPMAYKCMCRERAFPVP
uniref:Epidermal patterning factor-like protein n=1 Tax=Kalanchoe fedtschenkoi TaxID=63787 RepID=A0A7N0U2W8_KALFE